jgi:hypothetical protein
MFEIEALDRSDTCILCQIGLPLFLYDMSSRDNVRIVLEFLVN